MQNYDYEGNFNEPEVITSGERIQQLEEDIKKLRGGKSTDIMGLFQNPHGLIKDLSLTDIQAKNLKSFVVGSGTGAVHHYLSQYIGDVPASITGALLTGWLAKRFIG